MTDPQVSPQRYFVDEAGDPNCFDRRGRVIVGDDDVSKCFVVGAALIHEPEALSGALESLRASLLADPYLKGVPSLEIAGGRTACQFHAKDDPPDVCAPITSVRGSSGVRTLFTTISFRRFSRIAYTVGRALTSSFLERGEARYFNYLAPAFRLIVDRDDTRQHGYGEYYTATKHPLTPDTMMPVT